MSTFTVLHADSHHVRIAPFDNGVSTAWTTE